jgi:hypothetical protein
MHEVLKFLRKHENKDGPVGEFVRSCIMVADRSEIMTREELKESAQLGYLLDCFPTIDDDEASC